MPDRGWITDAAKLQDAAGADGNGDTLDCRGWGAVGAQVTGTFVATVNFEGTIDGSTWVGIEGVNLADGSKAKSPTAPGVYVVPVTGLSSFRARVSGYASGSVTVLGRLSRDVGPALQDMDITTGAVTANIEGDYPEDSPHVSSERGLFVMGVRNDADAARTDADGDYSPVSVDSAGRPKVVGPLTDTQLRATAVPVTGNVRVGGADATEANPVPTSSHTVVGEVRLEDGTVVVVKVAFADPATSGDNTIVAAVVGKKIRLLSYTIQGSGTVNTRWKSGAATSKGPLLTWQAREGLRAVASAGGFILETAAGAALVLNLSAAVAVAVEVEFVEVA